MHTHSPYFLARYMYWYGRWVWLFTLRGQSYGNEELMYITRKKLGLSAAQWEVTNAVAIAT